MKTVSIWPWLLIHSKFTSYLDWKLKSRLRSWPLMSSLLVRLPTITKVVREKFAHEDTKPARQLLTLAFTHLQLRSFQCEIFYEKCMLGLTFWQAKQREVVLLNNAVGTDLLLQCSYNFRIYYSGKSRSCIMSCVVIK